MLLINSFTITHRKLCKLLAFTCAVSLAVSLRRVLLRGIFLILVVSVEYFPGHLFLTAQNHGTEYSLSRSLPRPSHFIVRDNDQLRLLLSSVDSSSLPSALVQTMLLINSFTITQRKLCKLLAFTCAVSLAVSLRRVLLRGIFLIRVVSVEYFPGHFFLTAQNHGTGYSLSRSLPRPSHFIVRDNDQLRNSAPLLC